MKRSRRVLGTTPNEFIAKWHASELKERSAARGHFIDLYRLLGESTPAEADPPRGTTTALRARRDQGLGWRRLDGRVEAPLLRLGVQGEARQSRCRVRPIEAVRARAGEAVLSGLQAWRRSCSARCPRAARWDLKTWIGSTAGCSRTMRPSPCPANWHRYKGRPPSRFRLCRSQAVISEPRPHGERS